MDLSQYFNELLKNRNITVEKLSEELKIPKKFLYNLKKGEYGEFPAPVYVKGYFKNLAKYFNVQEEELLNYYLEIGIKEENVADFKYEPILNLEKKGNLLQIFLSLFLFIVIIVAALFLFSEKKSKNNIIKNNISKVKPTKKPKKIPFNNNDNTSKISITAKDNKSDNISANQYKKDNISMKKPQLQFLNKKKYVQLTLIATDKVWLRVNSDNKSIKDMILKKDDKYNIKGKHFFKIEIGNSGGIKIFINNKEYPIEGKKGEVKRIFINLDNLSSVNKP